MGELIIGILVANATPVIILTLPALSLLVILLVSLAVYAKWRYYRTRGVRRLIDLRDEVASGIYDRDVITRRLRQHDKKGICVHSIIYSVLRLGTSSSSGIAKNNEP